VATGKEALTEAKLSRVASRSFQDPITRARLLELRG
jgi:hypothetical protein